MSSSPCSTRKGADLTTLADRVEITTRATDRQALLLSIRPNYARAILSGRKTIELRRTRPNLPTGSTVIIYASSPTMAVLGWATLDGLIDLSPDYLWRKHGSTTGIARRDYLSYFAGATRAFGLQLSNPVETGSPIPLPELRELGVQPPQSWRYLGSDIVDRIVHI